ncbi:MAG: MBL fold metallo-hydrolase [Planctomycetes bacterium]|nr:MBL fold metallo-hydrolase [Planctomycetota bacterium]
MPTGRTRESLVQKIVVGPFQENTYLVGCPETGEAAFVDPGDEPERLVQALEESGLRLVAIVNTHAHIDHIGAVGPLKRRFGVPFALHREDEPLLDQARVHAALFGLPAPERPEVDRYLEDGDEVKVGNLVLRVLHVPGHAPGHVAFVGDGEVFSGDCLFAGSIGRTDLPGADHETLMRSIREKLLTLGDDVVVRAGHMEDTTIGRERRTNPFLVAGRFSW